MNKDILVGIGLTSREADAYIALLELGEASVLRIANKTKESRTHLYDTLASLVKKGLVGYVIKNSKKFYIANSPDKLLDYTKEKETKLLEIIPELKSIHKKESIRPVIEVYEGKEGIKNILQDILITKDVMLSLGSTGKSPSIIPYYLDLFHKQRIKLKIPLKIIYDDDKSGKSRGKIVSKYKYTKVKYMKKTSPTTTYIYGDKVAIILWIKEMPTAIMIKNNEVSESYRSYFELMWNTAKK